jgi:hypothetical protein
MMKYLPFIALFLLIAACKMDRHANDHLPVAPEHGHVTNQNAAPDEISAIEMEMFEKATHVAKKMEIDPLAEMASMKPIVESYGLTMERYLEIHSAVEENVRLQRKKDQLLKKLRD